MFFMTLTTTLTAMVSLLLVRVLQTGPGMSWNAPYSNHKAM